MRRTGRRRRAQPETYYGTKYRGAAGPAQVVTEAKHAGQEGYFECPKCGNWASLVPSSGMLRKHRTIGVAKVTCPYTGYPKDAARKPITDEMVTEAKAQVAAKAAEQREQARLRSQAWRDARRAEKPPKPTPAPKWVPPPTDAEELAWEVALLWTELGGDEAGDNRTARSVVAARVAFRLGMASREVWALIRRAEREGYM